MAASTKILTVSYGTFSCTLEGFDDSFHSMKAIAEYFRDLAQDDRYFGAEPPAPDAEMLARIAEREISRRVEAQMDGKGIRLRADIAPTEADDAVAMPPKAEAPATQTSHESPSSLMPAAPLMAAAIEADTFEEEATTAAPLSEDAPAHPDAESVAAKLQRIRAVVGKPVAAADDAFEDNAEMDDEPLNLSDVITSEPEIAVTAEDIIAEDETAEDVVVVEAEAEAQAAEETAAAEAEAKAAEEAAATEAEAKAAEEAAAAEAEAKAAEEAAAAEAEAKAAEEAEAAEAEAKAAEEAEADVNDLSSDLSDIEQPQAPAKPPVRARIVRLRKDKPAEVVAAPEAAPGQDEAITDRVSAALKTGKPVTRMLMNPMTEDAAEPVKSERPVTRMLVEPSTEDASADFEEENIADHVSETLKSEKPVTRILVEPSTEDTAADFEEDDINDRVAAAVKSEKPVTRLLVESPEDEDDNAQDDIRAAVAAAIPTGSLSDDDEDDLLRELASVTEDVVTLDEEEPEVAEIVIEETVEIAEMPEVVETSVRPTSKRLPETDDAAMSRIMTQTDEALNEPKGSRRRNAIAQLKAAVAATEAARQLGDQSNSEAEAQEAFREDLDQVVRPRRPSSSEDQDTRSERPRTAPLKLVASQRVDDDAANEPDVQPRRVASKPVDAQDTSGFAQFAAQMGATELPDLLEAAAAYTSFVEGVEDFSRPQIMKKVQLTTEEEFSREDGLRSFGTLLRQGRISKVRNGRFQISEQTRFRPDARSA